jgi:hypothetical protein
LGFRYMGCCKQTCNEIRHVCANNANYYGQIYIAGPYTHGREGHCPVCHSKRLESPEKSGDGITHHSNCHENIPRHKM